MTQISYWLLLVLGMVAVGIGLDGAMRSNWAQASAMFLLAIVLVLVVLVTRKEKHP